VSAVSHDRRAKAKE
jgi:hypothetical protein